MAHPFDPEAVDLQELVRALRANYGDQIEGDIVGRTVLRDAVVRRLRCSELQAEQLVDTLIARGFVERTCEPASPPGWRLRDAG